MIINFDFKGDRHSTKQIVDAEMNVLQNQSEEFAINNFS